MPCPAGTFQDDTSPSCIACEQGRYSSAEGQFTCLPCDQGRFQDSVSATECSDCEQGRFQSASGMDNCTSCSIGTVSGPGQTTCGECQSIFEFMPFENAASCLSCPSHATSAEHGTSCHCVSGYYAIPFDEILLLLEVDSAAYEAYENVYIRQSPSEWPNDGFDPNAYLGFWCAECPIGANCSSIGSTLTNIAASEGYFLGLDGTGTHFFSCLNEASCTAEGTCLTGYTGNGCSECDDGKVRNDAFECRDCPSVAIMLLSICFMLILFLVYLAYKIRKKTSVIGRASRKLKNVFAKVILSTCQINSIALSFAFNWDGIMNGFLTVQGQATSLGTAFLQMGCLYNPPRDDIGLETMLYCLFPLMLVFGVFFTAVVRGALTVGLTRDMWLQAKSSATNMAVLILFFLQPYLVTRFALLLSCVKMGKNDTDLYMTEDLSIQCWVSSKHLGYVFGLGLPLFVVYVVGVPLAIYLILCQPDAQFKINRISSVLLAQLGPDPSHDPSNFLKPHPQEGIVNEQQLELDENTTRFQSNFGFLFQGYHPELYFWEIVVIMRKACLSLVGVVFAFDIRMQVNMGLLVLIVATFAHMAYQPFTTDIMNLFELASLSTSLFTFFFGIFTIGTAESGEFSVASLLAILLNLAYIGTVYVTYKKVQYYTQFEKKNEKANRLEDDANDLDSKRLNDTGDHKQLDMTELTPLGPGVHADETLYPPEPTAKATNSLDKTFEIKLESVTPKPSLNVRKTEADMTAIVTMTETKTEPETEREVDSASVTGTCSAIGARVILSALASRKATKPNQLSFSKGDVIQVCYCFSILLFTMTMITLSMSVFLRRLLAPTHCFGTRTFIKLLHRVDSLLLGCLHSR